MKPPYSESPIGLLLSGGLDSGILLGELLAGGFTVQPFYVRSHLFWEAAELAALRRLLAALSGERLRELVMLEMPTGDLYGQHWSVTGNETPDADTPDEAVYLPGRNALLILKPALWCQMHGIPQLALAPLGSNPFPDATDDFFGALERTLSLATGEAIAIWRPYAQLHKVDVMRRAGAFPLELTFSCIEPVGERHCGRCNKCHERRVAFADAGLIDPTSYAGAFAQETKCSG